MAALEAERAFLKIACQLDTYGVDPHPVKDHRGNQLYLGINHSGALTFQAGRKTHHFRWPDVAKINFEGRMFIVHLNYPEKKHTVGFKCPSGAACRHVWCCAIEQMLFFTLPSSAACGVYSGGGLFSWGTKFKYAGRTEREILERDGLLPPRDARDPPEEGSSTGGKRKASSVPATPSTPMTSDFGYSSLPRSTHSAPLGDTVLGAAACHGGCLLSGPAVDIALLGDDSRPPPVPGAEQEPPSEYNFRESFEHSSSESATTTQTAAEARAADDWSRPSSASHTPALPTLAPRRFSLLRTFVPSFLIVCLTLIITIVLLFETDWLPLRGVKRKPEMVSLQYHYYAPLKDYVKKRMVELF